MVPLIDVIFILALVILSYFIGKKVGELLSKKEIDQIRKDAIKRSRAVLSGQFSEQLAPYLPEFNFKPTECRFIGKPIDFLVFSGMDEKEIKEIVFVEVKSGNSTLSTVERQLRDVIKAGKVKWVEYRIPENLVKEKVSKE